MDSGRGPYFFDGQGYEAGYFQAALPFSGSHWREPPYVAKIIREVDHLIYLPRMSSHVLAGLYPRGHKIAVGWLRDDSPLPVAFRGRKLSREVCGGQLYPGYRKRLRLVITLAEQVLLNVGPDVGTVAAPEFVDRGRIVEPGKP